MTLALDGHITGTWSSGTSFTSSALTTANANDIIAVVIATSIGTTTAITVNSVTATGVTGLAMRTALQTGTTTKKDMELWYGVASAALSSVTFTINLSGTPTAACCSIFGISGADTSTKFDSNASQPGQSTGTSASAPNITGMSTTNTNDFILCASDVGSTPFTQTAGSGFTFLDNVSPATSLGLATEYKIVSATESSATWAFGTAPAGNWGMIADAVIAAGVASLPAPIYVRKSEPEPVWQGAPRGGNRLLLYAPKPFLTPGNMLFPNDVWLPAKSWWADLINPNLTLYAPKVPFSPAWGVLFPNDAFIPAKSYWVDMINPNNTLYAVKAPFSKSWSAQYTYDSDVKQWVGTPLASDPINMLTAGGPPFHKQWRYDFEADKYWVGQPEPAIPLPVFGVEPFSKLWRYDFHIEQPIWLGTPTFNAVPEELAPAFHKLWRYDYEADKYWQGAPGFNIVPQRFALTFSKLWRYDLNTELPQWQGAPDSSATLAILAAGGEPFFKQWEYHYEPDKYWQGAPVPTNVSSFPLTLPFSKLWRYDFEPDKYWPGAPTANYTPQRLAPAPFFKQWRWDHVPEPYWVNASSGIDTIGMLTASGKPFSKLWRYDYEADKYWQSYSTANFLLDFQEPFAIQWRYDLTPEPFWLGTPQFAQQNYMPQPAPFFQQWRYDADFELKEYTFPPPNQLLYIVTLTATPIMPSQAVLFM